MPKNIENINPFFEEVHEEEERLYKNDPKHRFVPDGQIKTPEEDKEVGDNDNEEDGLVDNFREIEHEEKKKRLLSQEIKFMQGEGVASVGPDVEGGKYGDLNKPGFESGNKDNGVRVNNLRDYQSITSMNPEKVSGDYDTKKSIRRSFGAKETENRKTISESKRERGLRAKIRRFLHGEADAA